MPSAKISDFGFSEIYRPTDKDPVVDFIFVHGLQGHPYRTWASDPPKPDPSRKKTHNFKVRGLVAKSFRSKKKAKHKVDEEAVDDSGNGESSDHSKSRLFWPQDLLPSECPDARILIWGYDTRIARWGKAVNKNHLYSHGKDLLYNLCRQRKTGQPIIFIAHSLGGIVVKEALAISSDAQDDPASLDVVKCTYAVVFMGTPHRGSEDMAATGEKGRMIASALLADSSSSMLDSLGLENADLERCHDKFTQLWEKYEFRVKTFQEGRALLGVNLGPLNEKVVPHLSSLIGNPKEKAETLDADHREMCRFYSASDGNYCQKVGPEIKSIYDSILQPHWYEQYETFRQQREFEINCRDLLASLHFDGMEARQQPAYNALEETCRWILESPYFNLWLRGQDESAQPGLLWIKGKLGSGKSTLMREASKLLKEQFTAGNSKIASFFFACHRRTGPDSTLTSQGKIELDSTPLALFRSLLHQLLPELPAECIVLDGAYQRKLIHQSKVQWSLQELQDTFMEIFSKPQLVYTFIFVDGIDECEDTTARNLVRFFRRATVEAHKAGAKLNICFSSRNTFTVTNPLGATTPLCHEIALEENNSVDITRYVSQNLRLGNPGEDLSNNAKRNTLGCEVVERSSGVFLWVVLVVNLLQDAWEDGRDIGYLRHRLIQVPVKLEELYVELLKTIAPGDIPTVLHVLQWVLLSARPLELSEWHHIMAFIANPQLPSLKLWEVSKDYTSSDEQLSKRLVKICVGLVEVIDRSIPLHAPRSTASGLSSLRAGAGSFESGRYVYAIHDSVRDFFLNGRGFRLLNPDIENPRGEGHLYLLQTCINYEYLEEMDVFKVENRTGRETTSSSSTTDSDEAQSYISFGSSASLGPSINSFTLSRRDEAQSYISSGSGASPVSRNNSFTLSRWELSACKERLLKLSASKTHRLEPSDKPKIRRRKAVELSTNLLKRLDLPLTKTPVIQVEQRPTDFLLDITAVGSWIGTSRLDTLIPPQALGVAEQLRGSFRFPLSTFPLSKSSIIASTLSMGSMSQPYVSTHHGSSVIIPEVPSLSHYVQDMLIFHAIAVEAESTDPSPVLEQLFSQGWRRWAAPRLDMRGQKSPLRFAARWNLVSWIEWLDLKGWIRENSKEIAYSIHIAVRHGNEEVLVALLRCFHLIEERELWALWKAICYAATLETPSILSHLCGMEKNSTRLTTILSFPDRQGLTPLHIAARASSVSVVRMLLQQGPDPNALDNLGNSALHAACNRNEQDVEVCRLLIDSGCDIAARNKVGLRPLDLARRNGFYDVVEYIQAQEPQWWQDAATSAGSSISPVYPSPRSSSSQ